MGKFALLFVDDEASVLGSLRRVFRKSDYEVMTTQSPREGLELVAGREFALVLSDYRMPEMNGVEFLSRVRELSPLTTRMILTGYASMDNVMEAINKGNAYKFAQKPWNDTELRLEILKGIEHYEMKKEQARLYELVQAQNRELQEWNTQLEAKLDEKTKTIHAMNLELQRHVRELEARDQILHHLLEVHPVDETLKTSFQAIRNISEPARIMLYQTSGEETHFHVGAYWEQGREHIVLDRGELQTLLGERFRVATLEKLTEAGRESAEHEPHETVFPIRKGADVLGAFVIQRPANQPLSGADCNSIEGFASLVAIALADSQTYQDPSILSQRIQSMMKQL